MLFALGGWNEASESGQPAADDPSSRQPVVEAAPDAPEPQPSSEADQDSQPLRLDVPEVSRSAATLEPVADPEPPVRVVVESVDIDAEITPVGIADDGQMDLPENPDTLGWYEYGPSVPAESGSTVIAGHVDSLRFGIGPLARLEQVESGASVVVTTATGDAVSYRVVDVESIAKGDVPLNEFFARDGEPRLLLITCGGDFDADRRSYSNNVVVTAVQS